MPRERSSTQGPPSPLETSLEAMLGQLLTFERIAREQARQLKEAGVTFDGSDPRTELIAAETAAGCWHRCVTLLADVLRQRKGRRR